MGAKRIHTVGGSGSGTSTLGHELGSALSYRWLDADDFFWEPTDPPYTTKRAKPERLALLSAAIADDGWVLSGSVAQWHDDIENSFDAVIFLFVPPDIRLQRLRDRETARADDPVFVAFMEWAARYDTAGLEMRSLALHEKWLAERRCPVLRIEGTPTRDESLRLSLEFLDGI